MTEETPPDVANLRGEETVDWLVARREELGIADRDPEKGKMDFEDTDSDSEPEAETETADDVDDADADTDAE